MVAGSEKRSCGKYNCDYPMSNNSNDSTHNVHLWSVNIRVSQEHHDLSEICIVKFTRFLFVIVYKYKYKG